uniref:Uncharacterized protein n=1 Tax=Plectus sambesii TaxID=2011161 RepID=A0A914XB77_9BILA
MGNDSSKSTIPTVRIRSTGSSGSIRRPAAAELTADDPKRQLTASLEQLNKRRAELLRSRSASTSSQGSREKHPMTLQSRNIVQSSFKNPHLHIGRHVFDRIKEKRADFRLFISNLGASRELEMTEMLTTYLRKAVANLNFMDEVQRLSEEYGERHVQYRSFGFKPDFFASTADAITIECVRLDCAAHSTSACLLAFSQLVALMFSSVRDGYYIEMRRVRRDMHCFSGGRQKNSMDSSLDLSTRSGSPNDQSWVSFDQTLENDEEMVDPAGKQMNYLKPPVLNAQLRSHYY